MTENQTPGTLDLIKEGVHHKLHGVLNLDKFESFFVTLDGSRYELRFYKDDGWTFTPDVPPLPTKPGFYASRLNIGTVGGEELNPNANIYQLTMSGVWYDLCYNRSRMAVTEEVERIHAEGNLVRLFVTRA